MSKIKKLFYKSFILQLLVVFNYGDETIIPSNNPKPSIIIEGDKLVNNNSTITEPTNTSQLNKEFNEVKSILSSSNNETIPLINETKDIIPTPLNIDEPQSRLYKVLRSIGLTDGDHFKKYQLQIQFHFSFFISSWIIFLTANHLAADKDETALYRLSLLLLFLTSMIIYIMNNSSIIFNIWYKAIFKIILIFLYFFIQSLIIIYAYED